MIPTTAFAEDEVSITKAEVEFKSAIYTGESQTPVIKSVTLDGNPLDVSDFEVDTTGDESYVNAETYVVKIKPSATGSAKYKDNATGNYTISKLNLETDVIYGGLSETFDSASSGEELKSAISGKVTYTLRSSSTPSVSLKEKIKFDLSDNGTNCKLVTFTSNNDNNITGTGSVVIYTGTNLSGYTLNGVSDQTYSGKQVNFTNTYITKDVQRIDQSSGAYTLEYDKNPIHAGTYKVKAVAKQGSGYAGSTAVKEFKIVSADVSTVGSQITIDKIEAQAQTGSAIEPNIVVKENVGGTTKTLIKDVDYTVAYTNNIEPGTANVTVTFIKDYVGNRTTTFTIVSSAYDITKQVSASLAADKAYMYNGKEQPATVIVTKGNSSYFTTVYRYFDEKQKKYVDINYPIDARTYQVVLVGRSPYVGEISLGNYTIPKYKFELTDITATQSSYANAPNVIVKGTYENITFVKDKDYTVSNAWISTSTNKGYVTVTSDGTGNLDSGYKQISYSLVTKNISSCHVEFATGSKQSYQYTGSVIKPQVKVRDGYTTLTEGTDYTVTYKDAAGKVVYSPKDAGTYTIVIEGKGLYSGTTTMTFYIVGTDISGYTVTLKESSVNATGYAQTPVITSVKKGVYSSLTSNDYTVTYQDATGKTVTSMSAPGTYKVVVTGKNGYSGSTYATFRIVGLPQTVTANQDSYKVYTTSDSFKITAKATGDGTGFTYTSSNPAVASVSATGYVTIHKVGKAVITVTTTGNKKYEPTSKDVTVKVYPSKTKISQKPSTDGKKAQMKVRWGYQDGVTKYQIRYSRDKNFKSGSYLTKTVKAHGKSYTTQSTTISNLKSGYTYYFKVRAVYTDPYTGDTYYGSWSPWRSAKTK